MECDEGEEDGSDEEGDVIEEKVGRARVVEALKAHTWSNLELVEGMGARGEEGSSGDEEEEVGEVGDQVRSLLSEALEGEDDDFGTLFSQLAR